MSQSRAGARFDRQAGRPPFRKTFAEPARSSSVRSQNLDGAIRIHAIRSATIRDVLSFPWKLPQLFLKVVHRYRDRTCDMAGGILVRRSGIEHHDSSGSQSFQQLVELDWLCLGAISEMLANKAFEIGEPVFGDRSNGFGQLEDGGVGQTVENEQALFTTVDQRGVTKGLEMLRGIGERKVHLRRQGFDRAFALRQELEDFESMRARQGFADTGKLSVQAVLELSVRIH
jgi:hypothetical protein